MSSSASATAASSLASTIPLYTLEEHFTSQASIKAGVGGEKLFGPAIGAKLTDLSSVRKQDMSSAGVKIQVLSHTPFLSPPSAGLCKNINDELQNAVKASQGSLRGFATLPMDQPQEAATELKRAVKELGFVGALIDTHTEGTFYDGQEYDVFWKSAVELDVPIYIHPCFASEEMLKTNYRGNYSEDVAKSLGAYVYGWHTETGLHFLRLFAAGVFDRFPKLKICLGHMGEMIPYLFERQERSTSRWSHLQRPLREVWQNNVWVTTSGTFDTSPLRCVLAITPLDHVMLSIDYPFSATEQGRKFLGDIEKAGLLTGTDLEAFAHGNAAKLLKLSS